MIEETKLQSDAAVAERSVFSLRSWGVDLHSCSFRVTADSLLTKESQFWYWILVLLGDRQKAKTDVVYKPRCKFCKPWLFSPSGETWKLERGRKHKMRRKEAAPQSPLHHFSWNPRKSILGLECFSYIPAIDFYFTSKDQIFNSLAHFSVSPVSAFGHTLGAVFLNWLY